MNFLFSSSAGLHSITSQYASPFPNPLLKTPFRTNNADLRVPRSLSRISIRIHHMLTSLIIMDSMSLLRSGGDHNTHRPAPF